MKKSAYLFSFFILYLSVLPAFSQPGEWTFMKGDSIGASPGVFGIQGVPSATNQPPAFYETCEWTDHQGNFWMFGGLNWGNGGSFTSDMWKYDPVTNMWTWMQGPNTFSQAPVFGVQGVPSPANTPGNRAFGASTFTDPNDNLWLIYGYTSPTGEYNTLWKYDITTNEWTWMSGDNIPNSPGQFGVQGVPSVNNSPPGRSESVTSWVDSAGNFWTFGGISTGVGGDMNDLWRYNPATNEWTWMNGSSTFGAPNIYGIRGVSSASNMPCGRASYSHWKDAQNNLWFFGGTIGVIGPALSDLWKYDISTNEFTWMSGDSGVSNSGLNGGYCISSPAFYPRSRGENKACWTDDCGNFWMMGGTNGLYLSDLWKYAPATNEWTFVNGITTGQDSGMYGTMGVSSPLNRPPSRNGTSAWKDLNGNLWLYGGYVARTPYPCMSDLWKYVPNPACGGCVFLPPAAMFSANNHICPGTCIDFNNLTTNGNTYQWNFPGGAPATSTDVNPTSICYSTPGSYDVTLIASNSTGDDTLTLANYITVYPYPSPQGILQSGDTLFANQGAITYQWYYNGNVIAGATDYFYVATESGDYNVVATDANNCEVEAAIFDVVASVESSIASDILDVFPNPANDFLQISYPQRTNAPQLVSMYNSNGKMVMDIHPVAVNGTTQQLTIDVSTYLPGLYLVRISRDGITSSVKLRIIHLD